MNIRTEIVDAYRYRPRSSDSVLVDTQVWLALAYPPKTWERHDEIRFRPYMSFLKRLRQEQGSAFISVLSISEMASYIERSECQIATRSRSVDRQTVKSWRNSSAEARERVWVSLQACLNTIEWYAKVIPLPAMPLTEVTNAFRASTLDPIDNLLVLQAKANQIGLILTDDRDFGSAEGIRIVTANGTLLRAASSSTGQNR